MATSDAIAAVSETLEARLVAGLASLGPPSPVVRLDDLTSPIPRDPPTVTMFLYDIAEESTARNRPKPTRVVAGQILTRKPPLPLRLMYMMTAWGGSRLTEQRMIGRVLQVLHDDAILAGTELRGALAGTAVELRVSLLPLTLEDRARVWFAISKSYRLSVNYEIRVVDVDAETELQSTPVTERRLGVGVGA